MCEHVSKAKPNAIAYPDNTYFISDLECAKCGRDMTDILGMTKRQIEIDKHYTDKAKNV